MKEVELEKNLEDPTGRELRDAMKLQADGRTAEALALIRQEMELAPDDPRPVLLESRFLMFDQQLDEALARRRASSGDGAQSRCLLSTGLRPAGDAAGR